MEAVINMKLINTNLTERQFLDSLEQLCRSKACLYGEYNNYETFVYKITGNQFWVGKYTSIGKTYGFLSTRLNCKYDISQNGRVVITYRRSKHLSHTVFHYFAFIVGAYFCVDSFINVFKQFKIYELIFPIAFLIIGLFGLIIKPNKEWASLEAHLHNICNINK